MPRLRLLTILSIELPKAYAMSWRVRCSLFARAATRAARPTAPVCAALTDAWQHQVAGREQTRESAPRAIVSRVARAV